MTVWPPTTYPAQRADEVPKFLHEYVARVRRAHPQDKKPLLVGSPMGGFRACHPAPALRAGTVPINPAIHSETDLMEVVGANRNQAAGEEYVLTAEQVQALARYQVPTCNPTVPTLVRLDEADEVPDYRAAQAFYRDCGEVSSIAAVRTVSSTSPRRYRGFAGCTIAGEARPRAVTRPMRDHAPPCRIA